MILFPTAKINIGLRITGLRSDGFHNIESLLYPVPMCDVLEFSVSGAFRLKLFGKDIPGSREENILRKTWELLHRRFSIPPVEVMLLKNIPPGSGLGGGSSDAAFFLKRLNDYFQLKLSHNILFELALHLGSDVPFFLENKPVLVTGRGERHVPVAIPLSSYWLVVVWPGIHFSTAEMFAETEIRNTGAALTEGLRLPVEQWDGVLHNDFEAVAFARHPALSAIKRHLKASGAVFASLTGSGSALYGLFRNKPETVPFEKWGAVYLYRLP